MPTAEFNCPKLIAIVLFTVVEKTIFSSPMHLSSLPLIKVYLHYILPNHVLKPQISGGTKNMEHSIRNHEFETVYVCRCLSHYEFVLFSCDSEVQENVASFPIYNIQGMYKIFLPQGAFLKLGKCIHYLLLHNKLPQYLVMSENNDIYIFTVSKSLKFWSNLVGSLGSKSFMRLQSSEDLTEVSWSASKTAPMTHFQVTSKTHLYG